MQKSSYRRAEALRRPKAIPNYPTQAKRGLEWGTRLASNSRSPPLRSCFASRNNYSGRDDKLAEVLVLTRPVKPCAAQKLSTQSFLNPELPHTSQKRA